MQIIECRKTVIVRFHNPAERRSLSFDARMFLELGTPAGRNGVSMSIPEAYCEDVEGRAAAMHQLTHILKSSDPVEAE